MKGIFLIFIFVLFALATFAQSTCDYKVEILLGDDEFKIEEFTWRMKATKIEGGSTNITGTAEIKDSNDKTVKTYKPWTKASISKQKTSSEYTPNLKPGKYEITAEISVECDDTNKENNIDVKTIKIKDSEEETKSNENDNEDLDIKSTEITNKQTETKTIQKPVTKKPTIAEETDNTIELKSKNTQKNQELQTTAAVIQTPQNVYVSSNEKAKNLILIFLLTLSILLNIILIWKR